MIDPNKFIIKTTRIQDKLLDCRYTEILKCFVRNLDSWAKIITNGFSACHSNSFQVFLRSWQTEVKSNNTSFYSFDLPPKNYQRDCRSWYNHRKSSPLSNAISQTTQNHQWHTKEHPSQGSSHPTVFWTNKLCGKDIQCHIDTPLEEPNYCSEDQK